MSSRKFSECSAVTDRLCDARMENVAPKHRVENAGPENMGPLCREWKTQDWKTRERRSIESLTTKIMSNELLPCGHRRFCESCANEVFRQGYSYFGTVGVVDDGKIPVG